MEKERFKTPDVFTAAFLTLQKFYPELISKDGRILFSFEATEELYKSLDDYNTDATVEASKFANCVRGLKSRLYSAKGKGNGNEAWRAHT